MANYSELTSFHLANVAASRRERESMSNALQHQDLLEDASRGFSESDQLGTDTLIACTHFTLTFTDIEKWLQHYRTIQLISRQATPLPRTGKIAGAGPEKLVGCTHCSMIFTDTEKWFQHFPTVRKTPEQMMPLARMRLVSPSTDEDTESMTVSIGESTSSSRSPFEISEEFVQHLFYDQLDRNYPQGGEMSPPDHAKSCSTSHIRSSTTQKSAKTSRRAEKRDKWDSIKEEVRQSYVVEGKTLETTMSEIQGRHSFRASLRTWKTQVKAWNFEKNLSKNDMAILVAKAEKRKRDEGKETTFYCGGKAIRSDKIAGFKKRKMVESTDAPSPSAATPMNITYDTPRYMSDIDEIQEETGSPGNDSRTLTQLSTSRDSIDRGLIAGFMSTGVSTGPTDPFFPMDVRHNTPSSGVKLYQVQGIDDRFPPATPPFTNEDVDQNDSAKLAAITWPLVMKETWSSEGKALYLKRSIDMYWDQHHLTRRLICQLTLADVNLDQWSQVEAQKFVLSSIVKFLPKAKITWWYSLLDDYRLDDSTLAWLVGKCMQDYQYEDDGQILRSMTHLIEAKLQKYEKFTTGNEAYFSCSLVIVLTTVAMICGRANPLDASKIFDEIISRTWEPLGHPASVMRAHSFICRALHCARVGNKSQSVHDVDMARNFLNLMPHGKQRDTMSEFRRFAQRTVLTL